MIKLFIFSVIRVPDKAFLRKIYALLSSVKNKWMQAVSFLAMVIIFYSIVACDVGSTEGICAYRQ